MATIILIVSTILIASAGLEGPTTEESRLWLAVVQAFGDQAFLVLDPDGVLRLVPVEGRTVRVSDDVTAFAVDPFSNKRVLVLCKSADGGEFAEFSVLAAPFENPRSRVRFDGGRWRLPFWYSKDRWGAVRFDNRVADRQSTEGDSSSRADRVDTIALREENSASGFVEWHGNQPGQLLLERPLFSEDGDEWALSGSWSKSAAGLRGKDGASNESADTQPALHGVLVGFQDRLIDAIDLTYASGRAQCFGPIAGGPFVLEYPLPMNEPGNTRAIRINEMISHRIRIFDGNSRTMSDVESLTDASTFNGSAIAVDISAKHIRMLRYKDEGPEWILLESGSMPRRIRTGADRTQIHYQKPKVALAGNWVAFLDKNGALNLLDLVTEKITRRIDLASDELAK